MLDRNPALQVYPTGEDKFSIQLGTLRVELSKADADNLEVVKGALRILLRMCDDKVIEDGITL